MPGDLGTDGSNLAFVVGCPRSGTTWVQKLLAQHPRVRSGPESDVFDLYVGPLMRTWRRELDPSLSGRGAVGLASYLTEQEFLDAAKRFLSELIRPMIAELPDGCMFVEKTPSHAIFLQEINLFLPKARIIHVLRDPRDVVASLLAASRSWGRHWAPRTARAASRMWLSHVEAVQAYAGNLGDRFLEIRYEELHAAPEAATERLFDHLGLATEEIDAAAAVASTRADTSTRDAFPATGEFAARGVVAEEPAGFIRKGRPGGWRQDLTRVQRAVVTAVAGRKMTELGYR